MKQLAPDSCGFATALNAIGGKWKTTILWEIAERPRRFGELRRLIVGISEKVLTSQLRGMEADGLIVRTEHPGAVRNVEYSVTPFGRTLNGAVEAMSRWGKALELRLAGTQQEQAAATAP